MLRKYFYKRCFIQTVFAVICTIIFCEYIIYFIVLSQCTWPKLEMEINVSVPDKTESPVRAMFIADTHLLGSKRGHWFDKLRREWQMRRAFQTMITLHKPHMVFILGDVFDEGLWCSRAEFDEYIKRFHHLFSIPKSTHLYVLAGNHDMGFHYGITPYLNSRFVNGMKAPSVRRISLRGNHFVLINSMALEGDDCFLCKPAVIALHKIVQHFKCMNGTGVNCSKKNLMTQYSRPILLQHYPMYRESDHMCNEPDQAPENIKYLQFRERWDCLSKEASGQILDMLNPRLIIDGHTHHGCKTLHKNDVWEFTISSFSWRNKNNPSVLLATFLPSNYSVSKCYLPVESTIITIYIFIATCIIVHTMLQWQSYLAFIWQSYLK